jgi:hypothetical protein
LLASNAIAFAQTDTVVVNDTVTTMHWNLYNFAGVNTTANPTRMASIRAVLKYVKPDVFTINELQSAVAADNLLAQCLNTQGETRYRRATYIAGNDTECMLFYRSDKYRLELSTTISSTPRSIYKYKLYYIPSGGADFLPADSVYATYYVVHPKASNTAADEAERTTTANSIMSDVRGSVSDANYKHFFLHGDLNVYGNTAASYVAYTNTVARRTFRDVKNNSWARINYTQSPRNRQFDGGVNGGLDDRFDFILQSPDVISGTGGSMQIIPTSYRAIGNDGTDFNGLDLNARANTVYPDSVVNGVFYGSDHLPVSTKYRVKKRVVCASLATPSIIISATNDSLISSTVAARYIWTYNGATLPQTTRRIRVVGNGNYTVKAGTTQFCITPASAVFNVTSTQPLYNNAWATMATLNPTQFSAYTTAEPIELMVTDMSGKVVFKTTALNDIALPTFKTGVYIVKAQQGKNLFVNRIVVTQ